jgi:peptidoglycan hydrolase CwlO-like protein
MRSGKLNLVAQGWITRLAIVSVLLGAAPLLGCEPGNPAESEECQAEIEQWRSALQEANETIERLNSSIEDAQSYAGSSYGEMSDALENLETGEKVEEP